MAPSQHEIQRRYRNLRAAMAERGVDALLVCGKEIWGDDREEQARLFGEAVLPYFRGK